jgi:hypothetical protein
MEKYIVNVLGLSGVGKAVHSSGDVLEVSQIPGGLEAAESLVKSGHLKPFESEDSKELSAKEKAKILIAEADVLESDNDLLGALEKLEAAKVVYPTGKEADKKIKAIQGKLG